MSIAEDALLEKGRILHSRLLKVIAILSIIYTILNVSLGLWFHAVVTSSITIGTAFAWILLKKNLYLLSKIWNFVQINLGVLLLAMMDRRDVFLFVFYFPLVVGSLIVFQGKSRRVGTILAVVSFIALVLIVCMDSNFDLWSDLSSESWIIDRLLNVMGAFFILVLEIVFLIRLNENVQSLLIKQTDDLARLNRELKNTLHTREKMLSILAHDIRTPLIHVNTVLKDYTNIDLSEAERLELASTITKQSDASIRMLEDVLNWSKAQVEALRFNPEFISLAEVEQMIRDIQSIYGLGDDLKIDFSRAAGCAVYGDKNMLESVFRNLLSNAIKFSNEDRKIHVEAVLINGCCRFSIRDNGIGLKKADIERLKSGESFSTSSALTGSGLGNQLVLDFLKEHQSELEIYSEGGEGSEFAFKLKIEEN